MGEVWSDMLFCHLLQVLKHLKAPLYRSKNHGNVYMVFILILNKEDTQGEFSSAKFIIYVESLLLITLPIKIKNEVFTSGDFEFIALRILFNIFLLSLNLEILLP